MRILFATDLHGSKWKYKLLFEVTKDFRANVVCSGGDMLPLMSTTLKQGEFIPRNLDTHMNYTYGKN